MSYGVYTPARVRGPGRYCTALCALLCSLYSATGAAGDNPAPAGPAPEDRAHHHLHMQDETGVRRSTAGYEVPIVSLRDQHGQALLLPALLDSGDKPVMLNFIFTSCQAICPMMSAVFARVQAALGADAGRVRMVSVSIDPENDTPAQLADYAARFQAGPQWTFLTGSLEDSIRVQKAFDAYRGDKMNHAPLTLFRAQPGSAWVRYDGFADADTLSGELRNMLAAATAPENRAAANTTSTPAGAGTRGAARGHGYNDDYARLNATREGVVVLPSGVQYEVLAPGNGTRPGAGDTVIVRYTGTLSNGVVFDSTRDPDKPAHLPLDRIAVPGLREALLLMPEGAQWRVVIPPAMGYARTSNNMLRRRDLIYDIELLGIEHPDAAGTAATTAPAEPAAGH